MKIIGCNHIRLTNDESDLNVEEYIKYIERKFNIDFKSLPNWKEIVKSLNAIPIKYQRSIENAQQRKAIIVEKLFLESVRPSPFELSENLARTAKKWQQIELEIKKKKSTKKPLKVNVKDIKECLSPDVSEASNTKTITPIFGPETVKSTKRVENPLQNFAFTASNKPAIVSKSPSSLPPLYSRNKHKLLSPTGSQDTFIHFKDFSVQSPNSETSIPCVTPEWMQLKRTKVIKCNPEKVTIYADVLENQVISISVQNCDSTLKYVQFKEVTDMNPFAKAKVTPVTPAKIYPGLYAKFKFIFKISKKEEEFTTQLFFRVGYSSIYTREIAPKEALLVPVDTKFSEAKQRYFIVPRIISFKPIFSWQIKYEFGRARIMFKIVVDDNHPYHLHIVKRRDESIEDIQEETTQISELYQKSEVEFPILEKRRTVSARQVRSKISQIKHGISKSLVEIPKIRKKKINIEHVKLGKSLAKEIVDRSTDPFWFQKSYYYLIPRAKHKFKIYFVNIERIGYHQSIYDLYFYDGHLDELIAIKPLLILSEVLPHPIKIYPAILDMRQSPIVYGLCTDCITIVNKHKLSPVKVRIMLTKKMRKIFRVVPTNVLVPADDSFKFKVKLCTNENAETSEEFVMFTIKILLEGDPDFYYNVPPTYYEIIAPCVKEYKNVYKIQNIGIVENGATRIDFDGQGGKRPSSQPISRKNTNTKSESAISKSGVLLPRIASAPS